MTSQDAAKLMGVAEFPDGWDFHPVHRKSEIAGFFCTRANEIHAFRRPEFKGCWLTRPFIETVLQPLIRKYGSLTTIVQKDNFTGHQFVKRAGFQETFSDAQGIHYSTKKVKYARL